VYGLLTALAGCQRLDLDKSYTVAAGGTQAIHLDAPRSTQDLKVEISSPGKPVSACVVKEEESTKAEEALNNGKEPAAALAYTGKAENLTLQAKIPAKTAFAVLVFNPDRRDPASVKIKVTGR
jgi:hypothetical protein